MKHPLATLFEQFIKERIYLKNVTPKTIIWYQVAFKAYGRALPREALALPTKAGLQQFVIELRDRGLRPVTCNTYIGAMNAFCGWLHQEGHIAGPLKLKKLQAEKRFVVLMDEAQMKQLVSFKPKTFTQWRVHIAACLMLDTGLRLSEALNLKQDAVDLNNLLLRVFGKGQKERLVPFSVELRKRLFRYEQFKIKKGLRHRLLFATFRGTRWEARNSTTSLHLMLKKIGIPRFGWHRLRHTFATNYLRQGGDIVRLSMVLGHTQVTTTQRYLHLLTEDLSAGHERVSILNRLG